MSDAMGDRMKAYEGCESGRRFMPLLPVVARLDGKRFSAFTRGLARPYDPRLTELMVETTKYLVSNTVALVGYTQSDEITLVWYSPRSDGEIYFDGRVQKMTSVLAAECTAYFNSRLREFLPEKADQRPVFDCRVWNVPTLEEAANTVMWREFDATKNSITMAAQCHYEHSELMHKNGPQKQEMLFAKGVNWNEYPVEFKRGSYVLKREITRKLSELDLTDLPPLHNLRLNPDAEFTRPMILSVELPPLGRVANRVGVLFRGEEPITASPKEKDDEPGADDREGAQAAPGEVRPG